MADYDFIDHIPDDLLCAICLHAATDPLVTENCGHLFCRSCITHALTQKQECPVDRDPLKLEGLRRDLRAHRRVQGLQVRCINPGCVWTGQLCDVVAHLGVCEHVPEVCPYSHCGCQAELKHGGVDSHEKECLEQHLRFVNSALVKSNKERLDLQACVKSLTHTMRSMKGELSRLTERIEQQDTELETVRHNIEHKIAVVVADAGLVHRTRGFTLADPDAQVGQAPTSLAWEHRLYSWADNHGVGSGTTAPFLFSHDKREVVHVTPGWNTVVATTPFWHGQRSAYFSIRLSDETTPPTTPPQQPLSPASAPAEFVPSTLMVGVTATRSVVKGRNHLGATPGSFCFQDNAFVWDGASCKAYGRSFGPSDVVGVHLDYDTGRVSFSVNGELLGVAFDVSTTGGMGALFPAASTCGAGTAIQLRDV